jgi:uncharacterized membrane protein required for colicin V production
MIFDILSLAIIAGLCFLGYSRGMIPVLVGAMTWYGSMIFSIIVYDITKELVLSFLTFNTVSGYVTLILNYVVFTVALFFITQPILDSRMSSTPSSFERILGLATGLFIAALVIVTFSLAFIKANSNNTPAWFSDSKIFYIVKPGISLVNQVLGKNMSTMMYDLSVNVPSLR